MATKKKRSPKARNIGQEILNGLREIKAGKIGRVIHRPSRSESKEERVEVDSEPSRKAH